MTLPEYRNPDEETTSVPDSNVGCWEPSGVVSAMWISLGILQGAAVLFISGFLYSLFGTPAAGEEIAFNWLVIGLLSMGLLVVHQLIHAAAARTFGGSPRFDLDVIHWVLPAMYCRIDGQVFTRSQFLAYALLPLLLPTIGGLALMPLDARSIWLVIPLGINAAFSVRDTWSAWVAWLQPVGTRIQVERHGLKLIWPA